MPLNQNEAPLEGDEYGGLEIAETDWLSIVTEAYQNSTTYLDANYRKTFEHNIANFRSTHPAGSKYHSDAYRFRSRLFRPKTRAAVRRTEAAYAEAAFATTDVITVSPVDQTDKDEDKKAEFWQAILNHRLTHSIPWFLISIGALQETKIYGVVVSRQDWEYEEKQVESQYIDPITKAEMPYKAIETVKDQPRIKLLQIENVRFDSGADWTDPVNSSPYWIEIMPMYVSDVEAMMDLDENKMGEEKWNKMTRGEIVSAGRPIDLNSDSTRVAREGNRQDPKDADTRVKEFEIVWVFRNFIRKDGQDYEFYTLTDKALLTEPKEPASPLGRPYRVGISNIETHRCIPSGDVELGQNIQAEINDTVNQRLDNVKLVLNKGKYVKRNSETDLITLKRSYPGRIVMTRDPQGDIVEEQINDVTSSSYAEQDRLNNDMDDLLGGFSQSSVATNRKLNETVGGMNILANSGNQILTYSIRTFCETWVEPVLRDVVKLIQAYEDDKVLVKFGREANIQITDRETLVKDMTVNVSVGFGTLDPKERSAGTIQALQALGQVVPWLMAALDGETVSKEVFGPLGYRNGAKFFKEFPDGPPQQTDPMAEVKAAELELKKEEMIMRGQIEMAKIEQMREIKMLELALKEGMTKEQLYSKLDLDMDRLNLDIMKEMTRREEIASHREEMMLKKQTGSGV